MYVRVYTYTAGIHATALLPGYTLIMMFSHFEPVSSFKTKIETIYLYWQVV